MKLITWITRDNMTVAFQFRLSCLLSLFLGVVYALSYIGQIQAPAFGWDALDHWLFKAGYLLGDSTPDEKWSLVTQGRHPPLIILIAAAANLFGSMNLAGLVWKCVLFSSAFFLAIRARRNSASLPIVVLAFLMPLSVPLVENHGLIFGYAELWVFASLLVATALAEDFVVTRKKRHLFALFAFCTLATLSKNTGIIYAGILLLSVAICCSRNLNILRRFNIYMRLQGWIVSLSISALVLAGGLLLLYVASTFEFHQFTFLGSPMSLALNSPRQVGGALFFALVSMSSFNVLILLFLFTLYHHAYSREPINVAMLSSIFSFGVIVSGLFFFDRIFRHATPGSDTLLSRQLLVMCAPVIVFIIDTLSGKRLNAGT